MRLAALLGLVLAASGSGCSVMHRVDVRPPGAPERCSDGFPARVLVGAWCTDGVCGYTCAPDRWRGAGCNRANSEARPKEKRDTS